MPDVVKRVDDRLGQDRKVFLSGDCKEEQLLKTETPCVWLSRLQEHAI